MWFRIQMNSVPLFTFRLIFGWNANNLRRLCMHGIPSLWCQRWQRIWLPHLPKWKCPTSFSTFSFLEMFGALKWRNEERYLIFVAKLVAATAKPPQKSLLRREWKEKIPSLYRPCQLLHRKYRNTVEQNYGNAKTQKILSKDSFNCFAENTKKFYPAEKTVYNKMLRALLCFIEERDIFPSILDQGKIQ